MVHIKEGKQPFDLNYNKLLWNWIEQKVFHNHKDKENEGDDDDDVEEGVNRKNVGDSISDSDEREEQLPLVMRPMPNFKFTQKNSLLRLHGMNVFFFVYV